MLKKTGYQFYSCYSNEFEKNLLTPRPLKKNIYKWTEFLLAVPISD